MSTPTLDLNNIQGDILQGLPKRFQSFVFFTISNSSQFKQRFKAVIPFITTTTQVLADEASIAAHKASGAAGLIKLVGTNVAFSSKGLQTLGIDPTTLNDTLFTNGQLADASDPNNGLGDPGTVTSSGSIDPDWDPVFKQVIHGCFLVTGDSVLTIDARILELETILVGTIKTLTKVDGAVRPGSEAGHEHFGFQDGLSQPPVIGFRKPNTGEIATNPGVILLGEDGDNVTSRPAWAKDSSILVFRKLKQLVPEFHDFLNKNPIPDPGLTPAQGSALLGARMVGRWPSGAPIDRDPTQDNPADATDPNKVNDFDYTDDLTAQTRCPFTAHLRKMNPRRGTVPGVNNVQPRRIIRQGIPYGPEVTRDEQSSATTKHDRGLLFTCYQSTLSFGFHFLQRTWANNVNFPGQGDGFDPIIGQQSDGAAARPTTGTDPLNVASTLSLPKDWVVPRGGEYFLSPSISALKDTITA